MEAILSLLQHPLVTCLIGIAGGGLISYLLARWQMKNIIIRHDIKGPIDIGSGLTSLFPNVKLIYNNKKINFKIQYITGAIKNSNTKKDVPTLEEPIQLILPEDCKVLEAKLFDPKIKDLSAEIKNNIIEFKMPKSFLHQEEFKFCVLYKSPDDVRGAIKLKTRIPNISLSNLEEENDNSVLILTLTFALSMVIISFPLIVSQTSNVFIYFFVYLSYIILIICYLTALLLRYFRKNKITSLK